MKEWWQSFFIPVAGEIMFAPKAAVTDREVEQVLKQIKIPPSAKILDLACGTGRHSIVFARKGYSVTGLDFSEHFLRSAKKAIAREKNKPLFKHGDMKNLGAYFGANEFDLVVSLYNSFGYFKKRSDDLKMLKGIYRVLKPGGQVVINTLNGEGVEAALKKRPVSLGSEPIPNVFMIDAAKFDSSAKTTISNWTIIDARRGRTKVHRLSFQQNVYTSRELKLLLRGAGFEPVKTWGPLPGGPFDHRKSWHQTVVARK